MRFSLCCSKTHDSLNQLKGLSLYTFVKARDYFPGRSNFVVESDAGWKRTPGLPVKPENQTGK